MLRTNFGLVLAKIESTYGTDPTPTGAANLIAVKRDGFQFSPKFDHILRNILDGTQAKTVLMNRPTEVDFTLVLEARGNRTDGSAADISKGSSANLIEIDPLLQSCDLAPTYTAETSLGARDGYVVYKPYLPSDAGKSFTVYFYNGGLLHKITGCKANLKGSLVAGQVGLLTFECKGIYNNASDASIPGSLTWLSTVPPIFASATSVIGSYSPVFQKLDFDLGNRVIRRDDANSPFGVKGALITARDSKFSIDPETVVEATHPIWGDLQAATQRAVTATVGSVSGNRMIPIFAGVSTNVTYGDREGTRTSNIDYSCELAALGDTAGTEFVLKFS